jgi:oxygen-independent coproporphyrinogen-3 oxidase
MTINNFRDILSKNYIMNNCKYNKIGIYIHIPFCNGKCKYCSFVSGNLDREIEKKYFKCLENEINISQKCPNDIVRTIYFGGGTPSAVNEKYIIQTLNCVKNNFKLCENSEISIECNPNSVNFSKLYALRQAGFSRISLGAQNFRQDILNVLGRQHTLAQIFEAVELAKQAGFNNIGIDYIIGAKKLDKEIFAKNIEKLKNLGLKHISVYMLQMEKGTPLFKEMQQGIFKSLSDDECIDDYNSVIKILKKFGFLQYEISNFAQKTFHCKHNLNYWNCGEYLGFGVAAHSYINGLRIENTNDIFLYINANENSDLINSYKKVEKTTKQQKIKDYIMLSLRTNKGLNLSTLKELGFDIEKEKKSQIKFLQEKKLIIKTEKMLKLNSEFFGISNAIILKLIP